MNNSAFVFIKPHAVSEGTKALVKDVLMSKGIAIIREGSITGEEIDQKMLIDQHYYAIAAKATLMKPSEMPVPKDKFQDFFGESFDSAVQQGKVFNAKDACAKLGIDSAQLNDLWAAAKNNKKLIKFGGGFYCGLVQHPSASIYVFNAFFMAMREKFVSQGASIYYYLVEWNPSTLSWKDFRGRVLGPTDPADAPKDSIRGLIAASWRELGLQAPCNTGDNGVHASASPFEALAERMNWMGGAMETDPFGFTLLTSGVPKTVIKEWSKDPQVVFGDPPTTASLFDSLEDTNAHDCIALCQQIASHQPLAKESMTLDYIFPLGVPEGFSADTYSNLAAVTSPVQAVGAPLVATTAAATTVAAVAEKKSSGKKKKSKKVKLAKKKKTGCC